MNNKQVHEMTNEELNELMKEFLDTMCPEKYKAEFIQCLETDNPKRAEEIIDLINS